MHNERCMIDDGILKGLPRRPEHSHKGMFGKVLCIAGSVNMAGAAYLCAHAAYRTGAGLVRIFTPQENRVILQTLIPEAVLTTFDTEKEEETDAALADALSWADTAVLGPGLGREAWAEKIVRQTLDEFHEPLVLDADGIWHLSKFQKLCYEHDGALILTPHVGEFARLTGQSIEYIKMDIPGQALRYACENSCICVLKDAPAAVGVPEGMVFVNTTGNSGMSTAGSGDVLAGIIGGLLGQRADTLCAPVLGVWLHGRAGDLAAKREGVYGLMARHLIEYLPQAMKIPDQYEEGVL